MQGDREERDLFAPLDWLTGVHQSPCLGGNRMTRREFIAFHRSVGPIGEERGSRAASARDYVIEADEDIEGNRRIVGIRPDVTISVRVSPHGIRWGILANCPCYAGQ